MYTDTSVKMAVSVMKYRSSIVHVCTYVHRAHAMKHITHVINLEVHILVVVVRSDFDMHPY